MPVLNCDIHVPQSHNYKPHGNLGNSEEYSTSTWGNPGQTGQYKLKYADSPEVPVDSRCDRIIGVLSTGQSQENAMGKVRGGVVSCSTASRIVQSPEYDIY